MHVESSELEGGDYADSPKVSVCVITFNQEKYIRSCLQSIVDQEVNFNFELIISDDCSDDGTRDVIEEFLVKYPRIIRVIFHEQNVGVIRNYRSAHDSARGEYVAHCDGDDMWLPGKLQYQVDLLDANPAASQCWGCAYLIDDEGKKLGVFPSKLSRWLNPISITARHIALSYALVGLHSTQMYRRRFKFDFDANDPVLDYWIAFNMATKGPAIYSKKFLGCYRMTVGPSVTRSQSARRATVDILSAHLADMARNHSFYSKEIRANLIVRKCMSALAGHDLDVINQNLELTAGVRVSFFDLLKSVFYFSLQKLRV